MSNFIFQMSNLKFRISNDKFEISRVPTPTSTQAETWPRRWEATSLEEVCTPSRRMESRTPPPGRTFYNSDSSSSSADISSPGSLKKDVFLTLEAQKFRNMVSDCIYQGMDSGACTMVEITNYEHRSGGQTVTLNYYLWQIYYLFFSGGDQVSLRSVQGFGQPDLCQSQTICQPN